MATVLVVDDEFGVAEVLEAILGDDGHHVLTAVNGKQGLETVSRDRPDLVLVDFMMPILDGAGMLRAMAANPATANIPVVFMSSLPEHAIADRVGGYAAFIRKPFNIDAVVQTVARVLKRLDSAGGA